MDEVLDTLKEGSFTKITPRAVFALSPGYASLPDGLKFVYAIVALLSEGKAPNRPKSRDRNGESETTQG